MCRKVENGGVSVTNKGIIINTLSSAAPEVTPIYSS